MILIPPDALRAIVEEAEKTYPRECCGLLAGRVEAGLTAVVTRAVSSPNLAGAADRFEIDPGLFIRLQKEVEASGERVVGLYHSHPDYPAQPSPRDLAAAWDAELIWVIVSVRGGQAVHVTAHGLDTGLRQFREITLRTTDWAPYPSRETPFP